MKEEYRTIAQVCMESKENDPVVLLQILMALPDVPMHGPVHHFIVPAVMLTAYRNRYGERERLEDELNAAAAQAAAIPGAACANWGACGAGLGIGIFLGVVTRNSPLATESWRKNIGIVAACQTEIGAHGGPRCCKRDSFWAVKAGCAAIEDAYGIVIPCRDVICGYSNRNAQCLQNSCDFFPQER